MNTLFFYIVCFILYKEETLVFTAIQEERVIVVVFLSLFI